MKNITAKWLAALLPFVLVLSASAQTTQTNKRASAPQTGTRQTQQQPARPGTAVVVPDEDRSERLPAGAPRRDIEGDFSEALTIIEDNYVDGGDLEKENARLKYDNLFKSSIIGMLRSLDPHSNYYDPKEFEELRTEQRSEYFGIGASISTWRVRGDGTQDTYVMATFHESPAAKGDLRFGDRILEVDGESMKGKGSGEVRDKIRGPRGTKVKVKVERAATGAVETIELTRDAVGQPSVPDAYIIRPGVGYVDMSRGFNYTTSAELTRALEALRGQGMQQLVLDLRGNPGGFLEQAVRVAEKFLGRGQRILSQKGREGEASYDSRNPSPDTTPLVVLVNGSSASASEIVAGALQDHDRALIVGENSFGKGLVQSIITLDTGSGAAGLTLTSAKYYTPSGRLIQRDYSNGSTYDYYTRGGVVRDSKTTKQPEKPSGTESRTDSGRVVYGGGGIEPDEAVQPREFEPAQIKFLDPLFGFTRDLVNGRVSGFADYKVQRPIDFRHELQPTDFPTTDELYQAFKRYVAANPSYKLNAAQIDRQQEFVRRQLRFDIVTAAYGSVAATRVLIADDPQVAKAVEVLPRARELASNAQRVRSARQRMVQQ